ncbi:MAG: helix-turn-helix domain-containing protein [Ginsengibacter sp.]
MAKEILSMRRRAMNVKDVARFLKAEIAFVYAACNKGDIPFRKITGKLYKFKKTDVLKGLEEEKQNRVVDVDAHVIKYLQQNNILKG